MINFPLVLLTILSASPQGYASVSTQHMNSKATVMLIDGKTTLRLEAPNAPARLVPLAEGWTEVSMLRFSGDATRLAMIGRGGRPQAAIVDVPTGRTVVTYSISAAAISPDARALIIEHADKAQAPTARMSRFSLIPLNAPENLLSPASTTLDIHTDGRTVTRQSDFVWVDPEVVTFVEFSGSEARVVALQVDPSGKIQKRGEKPLPADLFTDPSILKDRAAFGRAISGIEITRRPTSGLTLHVNLPPGPAVKTRTTELQIWQ